MNEEIEINLFYKNKNKILSALKPNIRFSKKVFLHDKYYSQKTEKMKDARKLLRIRNIDNEKYELTYKGIAIINNGIKKRKEINIKIEEPIKAEKVLINLGFKKISEYKSKREYWNTTSTELVFVIFEKPTYLKYLEIEGKNEKEIQKTVKKIKKDITRVGDEIFKKFD